MTEAYLARQKCGANSTLGWLTLGSQRGGWWTLERALTGPDPHAPAKQSTAIPAGRFEVLWTHSPKFKRETLEIVGVPGHAGDRIHAGNTWKNTTGCVLVGWDYTRSETNAGIDYSVWNSKAALEQVEAAFQHGLSTGDGRVFLTIINPHAVIPLAAVA